MSNVAIERALKLIENSNDPDYLRQFAVNARREGMSSVARAADLRLYKILPSEKPGTVEYDVWRSIHALEGTLTNERGKTTRLGRTRQKITRVGELATVRDLVLQKKASEGFAMLVEREMPELTFEAVALRHADLFDTQVLDAARERLSSEGIEINTVISG